jgi:D-sedoheptulose 7-phosphate isomerase
MDFQAIIRQELQQAAQVLHDFMARPALAESVEKAARIMGGAIQNGNKIISCGNGGSHCDAMHFAEELTGRYRQNRKALPALCISDVSHVTCVANDFGFDQVFARFVEGLGQPGDVLLAISTSGQSANVIRAAEAARAKDMYVVALTGKDGGPLGPLADVEIRVPFAGYADRIQEVHIKIIHVLILLIEKQAG